MKAPSQPCPLAATTAVRHARAPPENPTPGPLPARDRLAPRLDPSQRPLAQPTYSSPFHGSAKTPDPDSAPTHASHRFDLRCQASTRSRAEARAYSPSHAEHGVVVAVQYQASAPLVPNSRRSAVTGSPDFLWLVSRTNAPKHAGPASHPTLAAECLAPSCFSPWNP